MISESSIDVLYYRMSFYWENPDKAILDNQIPRPLHVQFIQRYHDLRQNIQSVSCVEFFDRPIIEEDQLRYQIQRLVDFSDESIY